MWYRAAFLFFAADSASALRGSGPDTTSTTAARKPILKAGKIESWTGLSAPLQLDTSGLEAKQSFRKIIAEKERFSGDAVLRTIQRDRVVFKVRDGPPAEPHVDVVITWHCDNITWLNDISPDLSPVITIVLLHKLNPGDDKSPKCKGIVPKLPFDVVEIVMTNRGRDVHSQFTYVSNMYDSLATYTMFLQADHHWFIDGWNGDAHSFKSNGHAVNDLVKLALQERGHFYPVSPYIKGHPLLFVDRESNVDKAVQDAEKPPYVFKFDDCYLDMFNQARDTIRTIFGGNICELPEVEFVPGFQYMVSRDNILKRPREVWASLGDMSLACEAATYGIERLGVTLFSESREALDPDTWKLPLYCPGIRAVDPKSEYFKDDWDVFGRAAFWRDRWGCEPLSPFLQSRKGQSGKEQART